MRLDRLVGKWAGAGKRRTREILGSRKVTLNGRVCVDRKLLVGKFDQVCLGSEILQARKRRYVMLFKPPGVVSATVDSEHATVIDLINEDWAGELHLAGRLDRFTSGLVVLTNDSRFSESLTEPSKKVGKRYLVQVDGVITPEVATVFQTGIWFAKEKVTTAPARVELLQGNECRLTIFEGKHHQIKRMFARFSLKVIGLHREAIGDLELPEDLDEGNWVEFTPSEQSA
jgi:16S rRNA pseudouridine516 synthase